MKMGFNAGMLRNTYRTAVVIDAAELQTMFAEGKTRDEIARHYKLTPRYLNDRIARSASLSEARERGKRGEHPFNDAGGFYA